MDYGFFFPQSKEEHLDYSASFPITSINDIMSHATMLARGIDDSALICYIVGSIIKVISDSLIHSCQCNSNYDS